MGLKLRKVPIRKQISLNFNKRIFSKTNINAFINDDCEQEQNIQDDEVKALTLKIQCILIFDRAHRAFVSFIEAYRNHQSPYIFRLSLLNCGQIANGFGLLYLPKLKKLKLHGMDCFVQRSDVDFDAIPYKNKKRERDRQSKLKQNKMRKQEKEKQKKIKNEKEKLKGTLDLNKNK